MTNDLSPDYCSNFVEVLRYRSLQHKTKQVFRFLSDGETETNSLNYQELDQRSRAIATQLQSLNLEGERALLIYQPGLEFITAFLGCLYANVVAVPIYPPKPNRDMSRQESLVADAQPKVVLTTNFLLTNLVSQFEQDSQLAKLQWLTTDNIPDTLASQWQEPHLKGDTLAFIQYTSGSTGNPKGVMVSHDNLIHNAALINHCFQDTSDSVGVSWLPFYHDMGLIGGVLQPIYVGGTMILMPPMAFLQQPLRWLLAISQYKVTTSGSPNFAYDLCVRKITPEQRRLLDLSSWQVAFIGAEPIRAQTLKNFTQTFESCKFHHQAFFPCYGMAETTLLVSGGIKTNSPVICQVNASALTQNQVVEESGEPENLQTLVGCGQAILDPSIKIRIANPDLLTQCKPEEVGEIWVSGLSVALGYWNQQTETERTFNAYLKDTGEGPFLRTGDLGFLRKGELFITGRLKDVLIIRGYNHYPQDIELTVEKSHPALRPSCGAAFTVEVNDEERLVIVQEVERSYLRKLNVREVIGDIRQQVATHHNLQVHGVVLVKPGSIPKTSSGKIRRHLCRDSFINDTLSVVNNS